MFLSPLRALRASDAWETPSSGPRHRYSWVKLWTLRAKMVFAQGNPSSSSPPQHHSLLGSQPRPLSASLELGPPLRVELAALASHSRLLDAVESLPGMHIKVLD